MANTNYTPLYYLMNESITVIEVKINDLPENSPKDIVFQWLSINTQTNHINKLIFKSMKEEIVNGKRMNVRVFENAELRFDEEFAKFQIDGQGHILMNSSVDKIPAETNEKIITFLSSGTPFH